VGWRLYPAMPHTAQPEVVVGRTNSR
jgi:hypothetical protein